MTLSHRKMKRDWTEYFIPVERIDRWLVDTKKRIKIARQQDADEIVGEIASNLEASTLFQEKHFL